MMKKILTILIILTLASSDAWAFSLFKKQDDKKENPIKTFFTKNDVDVQDCICTDKEDVKEIKKLLKLLNKYSNEHDVEKIISLYDRSYRSFDGFNYDTFIKMLKETFESYEDLVYTSDVQSINLYGDKAVVMLIDKTRATIADEEAQKKIEEFQDFNLRVGYLEGECNYAIYLKKINNQWKITGDNIVSEKTSVRYGRARNYPIQLLAPLSVPKGEEYCLTLKMPVEKNIKVVASLGKEAILYPNVQPEDVFRGLPKDGILERIVRANKDGFNEYAMASVGIVKRDISEDFRAIELRMIGLAFLMQRVNLYTDLNPTREGEEDNKKESENKG